MSLAAAGVLLAGVALIAVSVYRLRAKGRRNADDFVDGIRFGARPSERDMARRRRQMEGKGER